MRSLTKPVKLYAAIVLSLIVIMSISPAFAKTRGSYILDYAKTNEISSGGFRSSSSTTEASEMATKANVYLILEFGSLDDFDDFSTSEWLTDQAAFQAARFNYEATYSALDALNLIDSEYLNETDKDFVFDKFEPLNANNKFRPAEDTEPTMAATYFGLMIYKLIGKNTEINYIDMTSFIMTLFDSEEGAFNGYLGSEVTSIEDTYYAINALAEMNQLSILTPDQKNAIIDYVNSFYVENQIHQQHFGGYARNVENPTSLMSLTYHATTILSLLGEELNSETKDWVLSMHDSGTGAFKESFSLVHTNPSAIATYYAVSILKNFDFSFDEHVWQLEISAGMIAVIVVVVVLAVAAIGYGIYYYKNR